MKFPEIHPWNLTAGEARALQTRLAKSLDTSTPLGPCSILAAADCSFDRFGTEIHAAVVVVELPGFRILEQSAVTVSDTFPYIPGLLSFRELPAILRAFEALETTPDVVLCDGQGTAHPRRLGIASHLGLWLQIPTVGCAKSLLCGHFEEPGSMRGDRSPLVDRGEIIGDVLRTRPKVSPLYVSPGHLCDRDGAVRLVLETTTKYRLPIRRGSPTRP